MKFSIRDRVEVIGTKDEYFDDDFIGKTGILSNVSEWENGDDGFYVRVHLIDDSETWRYIYAKNLKLITKGNDMEIEVGQVWEYTKDNSWGNKGEREVESIYGDKIWFTNTNYVRRSELLKEFKLISAQIKIGQTWERISGTYKGSCIVIVAFLSNGEPQYEWLGNSFKGNLGNRGMEAFLKDFKLITNIKGDNKMEKKTVKGIKLKLGMWVKESGRSDEGKILYISPQQCVYDCNGNHRTAKTEDLQIVFQLPTEPVNPKVVKAKKKPKKKK